MIPLALLDIKTDILDALGEIEVEHLLRSFNAFFGEDRDQVKRELSIAQQPNAGDRSIESASARPSDAMRIVKMFRPIDAYPRVHVPSFNEIAPSGRHEHSIGLERMVHLDRRRPKRLDGGECSLIEGNGYDQWLPACQMIVTCGLTHPVAKSFLKNVDRALLDPTHRHCASIRRYPNRSGNDQNPHDPTTSASPVTPLSATPASAASLRMGFATSETADRMSANREDTDPRLTILAVLAYCRLAHGCDRCESERGAQGVRGKKRRNRLQKSIYSSRDSPCDL